MKACSHIIGFIICTLLLVGCSSDDLDPTSSIYYLIANNSSGQDLFANIDKSDFINSNGLQTSTTETLARCTILDAKSDQPCTIRQLPFLASESLAPSKEQIMRRLIVSDQWMAENFAQLLDDMPTALKTDMYRLFASTTAVVIHRNIRPAFFWSFTGAIYLDPYYLWFTQAQKNSISQQSDYRAGFGSDLAFTPLSYYSSNDGTSAFGSSNERSPEQALHALSALLFHELAHATDFFPAASVTATALDNIPVELVDIESTTSASIDNTLPLTSDIWHRLADVMFKGIKASAALTSLSASDVGALFEPDGANDSYNYFETSIRNAPDLHFEDTAMLFEEVMMKIHFDINRQIAFASPLSSPWRSCADLRLDWTAINRYQQTPVLPRIQRVVDNLLPGHSHDAYLANPPAPATFSLCQPIPSSAAGRSRQIRELPEQHYWY